MEARFEFRFFDTELHKFRAKMEELAEPSGTRESEELYLVPVMPGDINVKYRDGKLDIKELVNIHEMFEQWLPVVKIDLPASGEILNEQVMNRMGIGEKLKNDKEYDMDHFIHSCMRMTAAWKPAHVIKIRMGFELNGCLLEYARVKVGDTPVETIAVEHTDPGKIRLVLHQLGMEMLPNVNYVKALNRIIWK